MSQSMTPWSAEYFDLKEIGKAQKQSLSEFLLPFCLHHFFSTQGSHRNLELFSPKESYHTLLFLLKVLIPQEPATHPVESNATRIVQEESDGSSWVSLFCLLPLNHSLCPIIFLHSCLFFIQIN
jgi:hypothetical protein